MFVSLIAPKALSLSAVLVFFSAAHLLVSDGDEPLLGQLPQCPHVRPHVQLAAHQHHLGVGAELLRLALPLQKQEMK